MFAAPVRELKASYAFVERNFNLSKRYWGWEIAWLVYASAGALSVSLIGAEIGDRRLILYLVIGAVFWNYLSIVFAFVAETIAWERWEGTLEYTMMAPVRRFSHLSPATYILDGVRKGLLDGAPLTALVGDIWPLLLMGVVFIPLGLWAFGRAEAYAKRTGKLKRVG